MIPVLIVPILTRPELLDRMIDSIDYPIGRLIIIDNGGVVTRTWTGKAKHLTILRMPSNLGVAPSWNLGIKSTPNAPYWLICGFDVVWEPGSLEAMDRAARSDAVLLSGATPPWAAFAIGDGVVDRIGLFDEAFMPAYFEDLDYERRCDAVGVDVVASDIPVRHDNSSTLRAGYDGHNARTFPANEDYYRAKVDAHDYTEGRWTLRRRRSLTWD